MIIEIIAVALSLVIAYFLFQLVKKLVVHLIHIIISFAAFFALGFFGISIPLNLFSILVVLFGGIPGVILLALLHVLRIAF